MNDREMRDLESKLRQHLDRAGLDEGYEVELVKVPTGGDRMVRLRTIEEALEAFEAEANPAAASGEAAESDHALAAPYLVHVRRRRPPAGAALDAAGGAMALDAVAGAGAGANPTPAATPASSSDPDPLHLPSGELNLTYLEQNATVLFNAGDYALARNVYAAILKSGERSSFAHHWIARTFEAEQAYREAKHHYESSIAFAPTLETYRRYGAILLREGNHREAAQLFERALSIKETPTELRIELTLAAGNSWMLSREHARAEKLFRQTLELDANHDAAHSNLGALHLQAGQPTLAVQSFAEAVRLNPANAKAQFGLATAQLQLGDRRAAHDAFARSLDIQPDQPAAIFHLVKCAFEIKSYATAARIVGEYVERAPFNAALLYSLAGLQFHLGRQEEADLTVKKILKLQPDHVGAKELALRIAKSDQKNLSR